MVTRSEISKRTWRARKRGPGKGRCHFCKQKIFAGGVVMSGHKFHKGCAEALGAGLKPAQVGMNPRRRDRVPRDAFRYFGAEPLNPIDISEYDRMEKEAMAEYKKGDKSASSAIRSMMGAFDVKGLTFNPRAKCPKCGRLMRWLGRQGVYECRKCDIGYLPEEVKEFNPAYRFGLTEFRPPAKWFSKIAEGTAASYFGKSLKDLTRVQSARVGRIVGGIWAKMTPKTRLEILKKYEPALANPRVQLLACPKCQNPVPVSRQNVYLKCNSCGTQLMSIKVKKPMSIH